MKFYITFAWDFSWLLYVLHIAFTNLTLPNFAYLYYYQLLEHVKKYFNFVEYVSIIFYTE